MSAITIDKFETATVDEWGEAFGLILLVPGTTAYRLATETHTFYVGLSSEEEEWVCQVDDSEGGCETILVGDTPEMALKNALASGFVADEADDEPEPADEPSAKREGARQYRITFYDSIDLRIDTLEFAWLVSKNGLDVVAKADSKPVLFVQVRYPDQIAKFASDVNAVAGPLIFESIEVLEDGGYVDLGLSA